MSGRFSTRTCRFSTRTKFGQPFRARVRSCSAQATSRENVCEEPYIYQWQIENVRQTSEQSAHISSTFTVMTMVIQPISMSTRCITPGTSPPPRFSSAIFGRRQFAPTKPTERKRADRRTLRVNAGNANSGGLFAPVVIVVRDIVGKKRFNKFRGKAIQLHSQVRKLRFLFLPVYMSRLASS